VHGGKPKAFFTTKTNHKRDQRTQKVAKGYWYF